LGGRRAAAERAQELPLQLEQTGARRFEAELERLAAAGAPRVGERVRAEARDGQVVAPLNDLDEALRETRTTRRVQPFARPRSQAWRQDGRRRAANRSVIAPKDVYEPPPAEEADLNGRRDTTHHTARPSPHVVD